MKKFVLIDGHAILHRAFHALPPLTSPKGDVVNAVYGFFAMLLKILEDVKPEYLAICFDRPKPTFRKELYVGYQAHRPKMDSDLVPQIAILHKVLEKMKIPIFEVDGYEADDLIGTLSIQAIQRSAATPSLARRRKRPSDSPQSGSSRDTVVPDSSARLAHEQSADLTEENLEVIIVSGDRDMLQLVNSHVLVLAPIIGITKMILFDEKKVEEKYGLKPLQIIDYKALVGDPSDNYPGVLGVGPKTAAGLLSKYKTLENLYQNLNSIENKKLVEKLAKEVEQAGMAKKLATIITDAPITLDIEKCLVSKVDLEEEKKAFEELGFKSLLKRLATNFSTSDKFSASVVARKARNDNGQLGLL